ncbi:hypothetical protein [Microbacterium sp. NPDC079995]|uniref:hypothetical protein n=1 Tax=unclassified Microbacterium TaxID=2609290 RepID=UPI00344B67A3
MPKTVISDTTASDAPRFRYIGSDLEWSWTAPVEHDRRIVTDNGDLILQLQDLWDLDAIRDLESLDDLEEGCSFGEFIDENVLQRWAEGWHFNLGDINIVDALFKLVFAFLVPSIEDLSDNKLIRDVRRARRRKLDPKTLPAYTLRVDGATLRLLLIDLYDGPFDDDESFKGAVLLRVSM